MVSVLLADDDPAIRTAIRKILSRHSSITVVGEAVNGGDALIQARRHDVDVMLLDIRMPLLSGLEVAREALGDRTKSTKVVLLTTFDLDEYVYEALRVGVSGFLLKSSTPDVITSAILEAADGNVLLSPSVTVRLVRKYSKAYEPVDTGALARLTGREREVLKAVATGLSNKEIAAGLAIAEETVKTHIGRILHKLQLRDRTQLVVFWYENGLG
ncbi:response regulator transcription factor [Tsukamurella sp. M9C]|uniref:response regulator n=1 Tax=unclassified Tsukamurella TaxID=2633480 RepID=UPI001CCE8385|nr:response regulator transcription factor [Tsukamurella sp. M9C]MCA0155558.1 response regulator transcription factor [Tsukamurella sp. M9C]